ncbi:hypothetical protein JCM8547_006314 [Rhodosporidiobolus lusitaniae]
MRTVERQRSSSLSDAWARTTGKTRAEAPSLATARRRSSGGVVQAAATGGKSGMLNAALGRRESKTAYRSPNLGGSSGLGTLPTLRSFESYSSRNVAAALEPGMEQLDDEWQQVCVRVLPLFNGEGIRGFVEDLNELVLTHVQQTFTRFQSSTSRVRPQQPSLNASSLVTGLITAELTDLIRLGCATLSAKLSPPSPAFPLSDERLLSRLNEVWLFFFTGILPHLEGVFWVLRSDDRLRAAIGDTGRARAAGKIDIRRIAMIEFRDQIVHPEFERLEQLFLELYRHPTAPSTRVPSPAVPAASPPSPPDIRRSRSQPQRQASLSLSRPGGSGLAPHPQPQRQHSSPSRLSPDPSYTSSFPSIVQQTPVTPSFPSTPASPLPSTFPSAAPSPYPHSPSPAASAQALARRRQMVAVLASLLTADDRQNEMDALLRIMRPVQTQSRRSRGRETTTASPQPMRSADAGEEEEEEGKGTGLTASPIMLDDLPVLSSAPPPLTMKNTSTLPVPPVVTHSIDARQRSRTMDSLDEEDHSAVDGFVHVPRPSPFARHSTDGSTPTVSLFGGGEGGGGGDGKEKKKHRRRSFLPRMVRSNSQQSNGTAVSTGGESTGTEDDFPPPPPVSASSGLGLAVPGGGVGRGGEGALAGEKLRRGLLRRNSSRKAANMVALGTLGTIGAANSVAIEDEEY